MNNEELKEMEMPDKPQVTVVDNTNKDFSDKAINAVEGFVNTKDHSYEYTVENMKADKTSAVLCYAPFVSLFFLLNKNKLNNNYLKFHVNQGLIITCVWSISIIITIILNSLFKTNDGYSDSVPGFVYFITSILFIISILLSLFGVISTSEDKSKELPIIGNIKLLK